jgi:branched-chain amino acid transport system permease protein
MKNSIVRYSDSSLAQGIPFLFVGVLLLIALPVVLGPYLASEIIVFAIAVLGYNILLGYGGELSFGHAAFIGLSAYGTIIVVKYTQNIFIGMLAGILVAFLSGLIIGWLSLRRRGIYLSMVTLAFAQMIYIIVFQATGLTGGANGISFPEISVNFPMLKPGEGGLIFYIFVSSVFVLLLFLVRRIIRSPFGKVLIAVRDNDTKAKALGYNVKNVLLLAFVFSAIISGVAGVFFALLFAFVTPDLLFWVTSGEIVLMNVIGGVGTLGGALIGATIFTLLSNNLTQYFGVWEIPFGTIIVLFVMFAPEGVYGQILEKRARIQKYFKNIRE